MFGALTFKLNRILFLLVIFGFVIINNIKYQELMIVANQEIAVHLKAVRNLTGLTSGRFQIRLGIYEINPVKKHAAVPFNILEKQPKQNQNRSQFDQRYYTSKNFLLKAGVNADINEICIFRLDSPLIGERTDICNLKVVCELIHVDYTKSKVAGTCALSISQRLFHSFLEMNFYDAAPCQVVGTIHSCIKTFQFRSKENNENNQKQAIDMKNYVEKYSANKVDELVDFLHGQGNHSYENIAELFVELTGREPDVSCIAPKMEQPPEQKIELKEYVKAEEMTPLGIVAQKRQRKKLFAPPENLKTQGDEEFQSDPRIGGQRKRRKKIFTATSLEVEKHFNTEKIEASVNQMHLNSQKIFQVWKEVLGYLFRQEGRHYFQQKCEIYKKNIIQKVGQSVIRFKGSKDVDVYGNEEDMRNKLAYQLRNLDKSYFKELKGTQANLFAALDDSFFTPERPIFFEEKHAAESGQKIPVPKDILIIMVHGLGACRLDMEKLKAELRRYYDARVKVYISSSNEARTEGNIDDMGVRLAAEVDYQMTKYSVIPPICFLGHSMGGLIIRSALPRLQKYRKYFHAFITLSSPHLGFLYSTSTVVDVGLWFINTMKKCTSIEQLTMQDNEDLKQTFLYKLSKEPGLSWFKRLVFLGSHQDLYVPYYSARIQKHEQSALDFRKQVNKGMVYCKMVQNLLGEFTGEVIRINVNFCNPEQNLDNLIGRAAHISFINSTEMLRTLVIAGPHYFF